MVSVFQGTPQFLKAAEGGLVAEMRALLCEGVKVSCCGGVCTCTITE